MNNQDIHITPTSHLDSLGTRLSSLLAMIGLSQSEFARRLKISQGFVSDVLRGIKKPGAEFLYAIKIEFGISVDWLLTGEGTLKGETQIDIPLLRMIQLQISIARKAILEKDIAAKSILLLIQNNKLNEAASDSEIKKFLDNIEHESEDFSLAIELYNGHLLTDETLRQRNIMASAVAYFESRTPKDSINILTQIQPISLSLNISSNQRNAGRDYYEG
ncbi:helix-turn-helix domain-containing protein [Methylophilus methylotrophus]|uniref:helix-turn-helix domain-containing protein n=1 Tax=Methylophilus methylotrophus TaxID=17 RepID=UPI000F5ADB8C|nr:helix-turn-helix transcriptional regulator [Methylophilus methylotrophus]